MTHAPLLISIVTPSYNQGQFIEETIRSILSQDYPHFEHIVIDGDSTDNTVAILKKQEPLYKKMQWLSEVDKGQADALQKGFALCQGDIICWLNSDDIYLSPFILSRVVALFEQYPMVDVVTGGGVEISATGQWLRQLEISPKFINYHRLRFVDHILQPATFFKKKVLNAVQLDTSLHYAFDWDLFIQMAQHHNFLAINEPWAGYRMWGENKTDAGGAMRAGELLEVTKRYVGQHTWQSYVIKLLYLSLMLSEKMPQSLHIRLKHIIKTSSYRFQVLTNHRVTSV